MSDLLGLTTGPTRSVSKSPDGGGVGFQKIPAKMLIRAHIYDSRIISTAARNRTDIDNLRASPAPTSLVGPASQRHLIGGGRA